MNMFLTCFMFLAIFPTCMNSQQKYVGNEVLDCTSSSSAATNASESSLYLCNGQRSSCRAFLIFAAESPFNIVPTIDALTSSSGGILRVPLRCACPTRGQAAAGAKYLVTYSVGKGDTLYVLGNRFNVTVKSLREANSFPDDSSTIYPFTTILIPMPGEPSSSNTITRGYKLAMSPPPAPVARKSGSQKVLSTVGVAAGVLSLLLLISLLVICFFYNNRTLIRQRGQKAGPYSPAGDLIGEIARVEKTLRAFKFEEIKKATGNFGHKRRIKGGVYRGNLGKEVLAVKKVSGNSQNEVKMLFRINHFNIVKLYGFCEHKDDTYLIYEYMKNGSLREWLGSRGLDGKKSWNHRIQMAVDVANGLLYLHNFTKPAYVHNRIKSSSILLDSNSFY